MSIDAQRSLTLCLHCRLQQSAQIVITVQKKWVNGFEIGDTIGIMKERKYKVAKNSKRT